MKRFALGCLLVLAGCASSSGEDVEAVGLGAGVALTPRVGSVVIDGCVIDTWQAATLASPAAQKVLDEVILLCLVPRVDGTVGPRDPGAQAALGALVDQLHGQGYRVQLGVSFTDESGQRYDGAQTAGWLRIPAWRKQLVTTLPALLGRADGVELDLQQLPNEAAGDVYRLVGEIGGALRPARKLGVFVPPSVVYPSDLPGGDAIAAKDVAPLVDRVRVMTLDYSASPGPTIDPGWAVDAARLALQSSANVDIAYPLYGTDFGPGGSRAVTYTEALGVSRIYGAAIERGPTGAPFLRYAGSGQHETWFDDAESTGRALAAWTPEVLPPAVGVLFYGLGAEDPRLWAQLAERLP